MIVGLTGGIGSGKSTVAKMFRELGVPVYDSDSRGKALMLTENVRKAVTDLLGYRAYVEQKLNRSYISERVFNNESLLQKLNAIVHPAVKKDFIEWVERQDFQYAIQETALIFENGAQESYDKIILITAPQETRIQRVMSRNGISRKKIVERIQNQLSDNDKIKGSDFIIENNDLKTTRERVGEIHRQILSEVANR